MNKVNLIIIGVIFLSLAIIIVIFSRSVKKIDQVKEEDLLAAVGDGKKKNIFVRFFGVVKRSIMRVLIAIAEWVVKWIKKLLNLLHFWLVKVKKKVSKKELEGSEAGAEEELELKEEFLMKEEEDLNKLINERDPAEEDVEEEDILKSFQQTKLRHAFPLKDDVSRKKDKEDQGLLMPDDSEGELELKPSLELESSTTTEESKTRKIDEFLALEKTAELEQAVSSVQGEYVETKKEEKEGFLKTFFSRFKRKREEAKEEVDFREEDLTLAEEAKDDFSDGVVKVTKSKLVDREDEDKKLIQEVMEPEVKEEPDIDEELGVDRSILERRILQKIERNPKDVKGYRELGELYIRMKNFKDAEESYRFILQITPRDIDAKRKIEKVKLMRRLG